MRPSVEQERREQLTSATARVIGRKGWGAATVRDVADEAGTSTGTIAYYYAGKHELFEHALRAASDAFRLRMDEAVQRAGSPADQLVAMAAAAAPDEAGAAHAVWIEFWAQAARDERVRRLNERIYDRWRAEIAAIVRAGQADGSFRADAEPEAFGRGYAAVVDGLATHVVLHRGLDAAAMVDSCREHVRAALCHPGTDLTPLARAARDAGP